MAEFRSLPGCGARSQARTQGASVSNEIRARLRRRLRASSAAWRHRPVFRQYLLVAAGVRLLRERGGLARPLADDLPACAVGDDVLDV